MDGLCCANCGAKIEDRVRKLDGVESADLSFMACKLVMVVSEDRVDEIITECENISKRVEPDISVRRVK